MTARFPSIACMVLTVAAALTSASAHHSIAMFDGARTVELEGTVLKFEWASPHVWLWITVPAPDGAPVTWGIESAAPLQLKRQGLQWDSFKAGDKTRVTIHPMKGDRLGGQLLTATLPGGGRFQTRDPAALGIDPDAPPAGAP